MPHKVEVDQSGKVEDTAEDTALALSNDINFCIIIPATVKRQCVQVLRDEGMTGQTLYFQLFAVALYFLVKDKLSDISTVVIDIEYIGREADIKLYLLNLLRRHDLVIEPEQIEFAHIGRESPAHDLALSTFRKVHSPDLVLDVGDILTELGMSRKRRRGRKQQ